MRSIADFSVRNPVAVNLLMVVLVVLGIYYTSVTVREFFPPSDPEIIYIGMAYPGSTPEEVEKGITKRIEDSIIDLDGIEKITSNITEGSVGIIIEVDTDADKSKLYDDIQRQVDRITDFPEEALEPVIIDVEFTMPVISVVVYGDATERRLKEVAEDLRDEIRREVTVSTINRAGARNAELAVNVDPLKLEKFNLTFGEVSAAIRDSNMDLPAGEIDAVEGAILVRTLGESDAADRIGNVIVRSDPDGSQILVSDVAEVDDGFSQDKQYSFYRGKNAVSLTVFKNRQQDAIQISKDVRAFIEKRKTDFAGESIQLATRADSSRYINDRQMLLLRNGTSGLILVFICLALFLDFRVAKWTAIGLPISFMGTFIAMNFMGVTINMISLFGLIIVIGLIVDDAIIIGENVFRHYEEGMPPHKAAIEGAREVTWPVIAAVTTTVIAFFPLIFLEGIIGDFLGQLPLVVVAALSVSLIEALIILPSHLAETLMHADKNKAAHKKRFRDRVPGLDTFLKKKEQFLNRTLPDLYERAMYNVAKARYIFIAGMFSILLITLGFVESGKLKFVLFQDTDSEIVIVNLDMGPGTQAHETMDVIRFIQSEAEKFEEVEGVISFVGSRYSDDGTRNENTTEGIGQLVLDLRGAEYRDSRGLRKSQDLIDDLRIQVGPIPGAKSLKYEAAQGGPPGGDIELELRAPDYEMLSAATDEIIDRMAGYSGVTDIEDSLELGKSEVRIKLLPAAEALNLTTRDLAWQIRGAFFGDEAQSLQRDREEVKVYTRLKPEARDDLAALENFRVKLPSGERVPFSEVATFEMGRGYSRLTRIDGQRAVRITAQVMESKGNITEITNDLEAYLAEASRTKYSGLNYTFAGEKKKVTDAFSSLKVGVPAALLGIYALLAIIFHSYLQPLIIMAAIPFGIVGAIWGHPIMGYPLTMLSVIGIAALSGIVVNDSLILVDFVNEQVRRGNHNLIDAVVRGGRLRLRAIILTTLTTVFGLAPLMLERSFQAQFLIPMAVSISFGLAFATIITLLLVPSLYLVLEDIRRVFIWIVFNKTGDIDPIGMRAIRTEEAIRKGYEQSEENAPAPIS